MTAPEDPPGPIVVTEARKAAWDNGFRLERGREPGGWLRYGSTTAPGEVWIAGRPYGPWSLSVGHPGVAAEFADQPAAPLPGPGAATWIFDSLTALHERLERVYRLAVSLPDAPLARFEEAVAGLPRTTEAERLRVERVGQDLFRAALIDYWDGRCAVTGLAVPELLRASHIKPWAACDTDAERLDVFNGLLLAPHLDAAYDQGFVTVEDDGAVTLSPTLPGEAVTLLGLERPLRVAGLGERHRRYLAWHREKLFKKG